MMKSLLQYINEAKSKTTVEWMKEHYAKYNKELFDNELPSNIQLSLFNDRKSNALGLQGFNVTFYCFKEGMENGMYKMYYHPTKIYLMAPFSTIERDCLVAKKSEELRPYIKMNTVYDMSDFQKEDTLIHEMIHLWVSKDGLSPKRAHGKEFKAKCNEIRIKAKKLYDIEYSLNTYAINSNDEDKGYSMNEETKNAILYDLKHSAKRGGGICSVYITYEPNENSRQKIKEFPKRFLFCTKNKLKEILRQITSRDKEELRHIYVSFASYIPMSHKYGKFSTFNRYNGFFDASKYDTDLLMEEAEDVFEVNESLLSKIKTFIQKIVGAAVMITSKTPASEIDMEDLLDAAEKEAENEEEIKGDEKLNSKIIEND